MAKKTSVEKPVEVQKQSKGGDSFNYLPLEQREALIEKLAELGFVGGEKLTDGELIDKIQDLALSKHRSAINEEADLIAIKMAGLFSDSVITDMDFKLRLFEYGIPKMYIHLFNDTHANLVQPKYEKRTDEETGKEIREMVGYNMEPIWKIIRFSGINPLSTEEIFKSRIKEPLL